MFRNRNNSKNYSTSFVRRRSSSKTAKEKQKGSANLFEVKSKKIGTINDLIYKDTSSTSSYPWSRLMPLNETTQLKGSKKLVSLKFLCAKKLAENVDALETSYLDYAPWTCWSLVWDIVMSLHNDSFRVFSMFASKFSKFNNFKSHRLSINGSQYIRPANRQTLANLRTRSIKSSHIPNSNNHRLENLFSNVNLSGFVKYIHQLSYQPIVLLDISRAVNKLTKDDYFMIFNIPNLVALDLSNSTIVDNQFLYNLFVSITKEDKLNKLTLLSLNDCPNVTAEGLKQLLSISNIDGMISPLAYIESDSYVITSDFAVRFQGQGSKDTYVKGTKWILLNQTSEEAELLSKLPLGLKLHTLRRLFSRKITKKDNSEVTNSILQNITNPSDHLYHSQGSIILDIMFQEEKYLTTDTSNPSGIKLLEETWRNRLNARNAAKKYETFCYVIDNNYTGNMVEELAQPFSRSESNHIQNKNNRKKVSKITKRKKLSTTKTSVKSFFEL